MQNEPTMLTTSVPNGKSMPSRPALAWSHCEPNPKLLAFLLVFLGGGIGSMLRYGQSHSLGEAKRIAREAPACGWASQGRL